MPQDRHFRLKPSTRRKPSSRLQIRSLMIATIVANHAASSGAKLSGQGFRKRRVCFQNIDDRFFAEPDAHFRGRIIPQFPEMRQPVTKETQDSSASIA